MSAHIVQAHYDEIDKIAARFSRSAQVSINLRKAVERATRALEQGGWEGEGAAGFFSEMHGKVLPALQRLTHALEGAQRVTATVKTIIQQAEDEAAEPFKGKAKGYVIETNAETGNKVYRFTKDIEVVTQAGAAEPSWLTTARGEIGIKELKGKENNEPRINEYFDSTTRAGRNQGDEEAWCSAFANWSMEKAGYKGTDSTRALKWKEWGQPLDKPAVGAVAVIDHGGGKGHVGFVVGRDINKPGNLLILGGNQHDQVKVSSYPESKFVAFRVPEGYVVPPSAYELPKESAAVMTKDR